MQTNGYETVFIAEDEAALVGYILVLGNPYKKKLHAVELVLGVLEEYRGHGIGKKLIAAAESWAKGHNIHRIELTVNPRNSIALELYKKLGFEIEGLKRHTTLTNGEFQDDYVMAKLMY